MNAVISAYADEGVSVVVLYDEQARLVLHPGQGSDVLDSAVDISTWAADLIMLALLEPAGVADSAPRGDDVRLSLCYSHSFVKGDLELVSDEVAQRCVAVISSPRERRVELLCGADLVGAAASGLAIQVLGRIAANDVRDIDAHLAALLGGESA